MQPGVSSISYATPPREQTGEIITFAQFEEGGLVENEHNAEENESIYASIYESSIYDDSDSRSIRTNNNKEVWDGSQIYSEINARYTILKICYHIG